MYKFRKSEDVWTKHVTFCISVTINEYFGAWKSFERREKNEVSVFI